MYLLSVSCLYLYVLCCICMYLSLQTRLTNFAAQTQTWYIHDTVRTDRYIPDTDGMYLVCMYLSRLYLYLSLCIVYVFVCNLCYLSVPDVFFSIMCVSVCVFCVCMYLYLWGSICMYLIVSSMYLHVLHKYFADNTETASTSSKQLVVGRHQRAAQSALKSSQGLCANTLFRNPSWRSTRLPYFAYPLRAALVPCPWSALPTPQRGGGAGQIPAHSSVLMPNLNWLSVLELPQRPGPESVCHTGRPSKPIPCRDWRVPVSVFICMYQYVYGYIMFASICICTYLSVLPA